MRWYFFVAYFFCGPFLVNAVPHFVNGVSGRSFPIPFASAAGVVVAGSEWPWGSLNAVVGIFLSATSGSFTSAASQMFSPREPVAC